MCNNNNAGQIPESAWTLSESCIRHARQSGRLLTDSWMNGSFMTFDYSYTQYAFSATCVLIISKSLDSQDHASDTGQVKCLSDLLLQLKQHGNFVAKEFCTHIDAIQRLPAAMDTELFHGSGAPRLSCGNLEDPSTVERAPNYQHLSALDYDMVSNMPSSVTLTDLDFIDASMYASDLGIYLENEII